jgi:hypothetical protein
MAKGWLDNYGKQENYNNSKTSVPEGYVGEGYDTTGRDYSPAWGGQFEEGGELIPMAQNGRATAADSLDVYNRSLKIDAYYNNLRKKGWYKKPKITDVSWLTSKDLKEELKRINKETVDTYNDQSKQDSDDSYLTKMYPNKNIKETNLKALAEHKKLTRGTRYAMKDLYPNAIDPVAPTTVVDTRIIPKEVIDYDMRGDSNDISVTPPGGSMTGLYRYDPLSVKPWNMLTDAEKKLRVKKYGTDGVPKSYINASKDKLNKDPKPDKKPNPNKKLNIDPKPKQEVVQPDLPRVEAINLPPMQQLGSMSAPTTSDVVRQPKSYNISRKTYNMKGLNDYYTTDEEGVDYERAMLQKSAADAWNRDILKRYGPQNEYRTPKSAADAAERLKQLRSEFEMTPNYQMGGSVYPVNYVPEAQMGASIPGAVGFSYARTQSPAPSNGPYAKKTMASAQDGAWLNKYDVAQNGEQIENESADEEPQFAPITIEEVVVKKPLTNFGKVRSQISKKNTWEDYAQRYLGNFEKNMGQTINNLPESRKKEYEDYVNKLAFDEYIKKYPKPKGEDRGAYIDRIQAENADSSNFERAYEQNADYNDETDVNKWRKGLIGLGSLVLPKPAMDRMKQSSDYFSKKEKQAMRDNPISTYANDVLGTLDPLSIPVEGIYGNKSFGDIASGQSADVPMSMRILGDPMMVLGEAAPLLGKGLSTAAKALGTEEGLLSNMYKLNPRAFTPNAESYYRKIGDEGYIDALTSGIVRPKQQLNITTPNRGVIDISENFQFKDPYFSKGKPLETYKGKYMIEAKDIPMEERIANTSYIPKNTLETSNPNLTFYEKDWWQGYKPLEVPTNSLSSTKNVFNNIIPPRNILVDEKYMGNNSMLNALDKVKSTALPSKTKLNELREAVDDGELWKYSDINPIEEIERLKKAAKTEADIAYVNALEKQYDKNVRWHDASRNRANPVFLTGQSIEDLVNPALKNPEGDQWFAMQPFKYTAPKGKNLGYIADEADYIHSTKYRLPGNRWDTEAMLRDMGESANESFNSMYKPFNVNMKDIPMNKNGGVTKDDMGYWNPDNWGSPVEIGSTDITMEGVYEPLLGISDTGDTKLMKPGKNYKFKGKKVTEYPMAKNGLRQEQKGLVNLDQLTNFTNYNTKQPGGWLDKY